MKTHTRNAAGKSAGKGRWSWWVLLAVLGVLGSATGHAASRWEILVAIHSIENPRDLTRPGQHGELGAYQFRRSTWKMHTREPFQSALERTISDQVAVLHYEWICRGLVRNGCLPTPYNIGLAWNGGLMAAVKGRSPPTAHGYAQRLRNIVEDGAARRYASTP